MESLGVALLSGILAFFGAIVGHFVAFDLNTKGKRRDVRRGHIERFAEHLSEDETWLDRYRQESLFLEGKKPIDTAPYDKAFALYLLYFGVELAESMEALQEARFAYLDAMNRGLLARMELAAKTSAPSLARIALPAAEVKSIIEKFGPYYEGLLRCLAAASNIAIATIPEESAIKNWWDALCSRVRRVFSSIP
jgi:hypothetical protein